MSETIERASGQDYFEDAFDRESADSTEKIKERFEAIVSAIDDRFQTFSPAEVERLAVEASDKTWGNTDDGGFKPYTGPSYR